MTAPVTRDSALNQTSLQLLLFVDDRPSSMELSKELQTFLASDRRFIAELQVVDVSEYPDLAEHFKVVMTPALIKTTPLPRQTLTGKNILTELQNYWIVWTNQAQANFADLIEDSASTKPVAFSEHLSHSTQILRLNDQIFQLNQKKAELEAQLHFKDRIISMLAHDLRNPLTTVSLALETVELSGGKLTDQKKSELFQHARRQVKISDAMISDILEASHGANSELRIRLQRTSLLELGETVVNDLSLRHHLELKDQILTVNIPHDLPPVFADAERIRQVFVNILENAIKYTEPGGKIHLSALHRTTQKVEVTITDSGLGIPLDMREKIFQHKYRIQDHGQNLQDQPQAKIAESGYGIGLSTCQQIIRAHFGQIWVDSPSKEGSCFHFTLPVY